MIVFSSTHEMWRNLPKSRQSAGRISERPLLRRVLIQNGEDGPCASRYRGSSLTSVHRGKCGFEGDLRILDGTGLHRLGRHSYLSPVVTIKVRRPCRENTVMH